MHKKGFSSFLRFHIFSAGISIWSLLLTTSTLINVLESSIVQKPLVGSAFRDFVLFVCLGDFWGLLSDLRRSHDHLLEKRYLPYRHEPKNRGVFPLLTM